MGADDVPTIGGAGHRVVERGHLGQGVGILAGFLRDRGVLAVEPARGVEERSRAHRDDSAKVEGFRGIEHVLGAADVDGLEVGHVLARAAEERSAVDGGIAARRCPQHRLGVGHVAGHHLDAERGEWRGIRRLPSQGTDTVAPLHQELADVGAGQPRGARHQDGLVHECSAGSLTAEST